MNAKPSAKLLQSSALVGIGTGLSRITGMLRVVALAYALGQTLLTDAYNLANTAPNVIYELIVGGILTATLIPTFVDAFDRKDHDAINAVTSVAVVALLAITAIAIVAAPVVIWLYTVSKDTGKADQVAVAVPLLRLFFPQILFYGLTTVATSLLNARRSFAAPAFAPVLNNLLVCAMFLSIPTFFPRPGGETPDIGFARDNLGFLAFLGIGTTAGIALMTLVLWPAMRRAEIKIKWNFDLHHPAVRGLASLTGWTIGFVIANQVAFFVVRALANGGNDGDVSAYENAYIFFQLPHGLLAVSLITTFLPGLAALGSKNDLDGYRNRFNQGLRLVVLVVLPAAVGYVLIARPLISILLERGQFTADDSILTAGLLQWMAVGLVGYSVYVYVIRGFYALKDTKTTFLLAVLQNLTNIVTAFVLTDLYGIKGLAASFSISYVVGAIGGLALLRQRVGGLDVSTTLAQVARMAVAATLMGVAVWGVTQVVGGNQGAGAVLRTVLGVVTGAVVYLLGLLVLRVGELDDLRQRLPGRSKAA